MEMIFAARAAVDRVSEKLHTQNPAKYHLDRPYMGECSFDPDCPFTKSATE